MNWHETQFGDPASRAVLLLHGFMGRGEDWGGVVSGLSDRFHCICPDLPGHGATPSLPAKEGCMESTSAALVRRLDELDVPQCALVGYSMGGRLALYLALREPARFGPVVLESASPGLKTETLREERRAEDERRAQILEQIADDRDAFREFLETWYGQPLFSSLDNYPEARTAMIEQRLENDPVALAQSLRHIGTGAQPSLWGRLPELTTPTLAIVGARDRKFRQIAEEMSDRCPRIAVHEMANCGHNVHFENPSGYTTVVRAFLESAKG